MDYKYIKDNFYLGGYYIVRSTHRKAWMNDKVVPERILSCSRCICEFYPNITKLWSESENEREKYRKDLKLDKFTYEEMELCIQDELENRFDFPDVFNDIGSAKEFCHRFLENEDDIKVIGIGIHKKYREKFINEHESSVYGVCENVYEEKSLDISGTPLGYEILGFDAGGFHSYLCNHLDDEYHRKFKIELNEYGFIETMEEGDLLAEYTNEEIQGTDSELWIPWVVLAY